MVNLGPQMFWNYISRDAQLHCRVHKHHGKCSSKTSGVPRFAITGLGYKKIAKTLKLSCSTVAKTIQRFNRTGSTQNRPRHGQPKWLSGRAQHHIHRLFLGNRRMSAASIAAEVELHAQEG